MQKSAMTGAGMDVVGPAAVGDILSDDGTCEDAARIMREEFRHGVLAQVIRAGELTQD